MSNTTSLWQDRSGIRPLRHALRRFPLLTITRRLRRVAGVPAPATGRAASNAEILERVRDLPLSYWSYEYDDPSVRHLGPMAQDFAAAFGLGESNRVIGYVDAIGVLMACVQELSAKVERLEAGANDEHVEHDEESATPPKAKP